MPEPSAVEEYDPTEKQIINTYRNLSLPHQYALRAMLDTLVKVQEQEDCPEILTLTSFDNQLAAGIGDPSEFEDRGSKVYVYATQLTKQADYLFYINGESMEPEFYNGERVLVRASTDTSEITPGEIGAFMVNNELYIKRYFPDGLHSLNPKYPTMHFSDNDEVTLIGKVLGKFRDYNIVSNRDLKRYRALHPEFS